MPSKQEVQQQVNARILEALEGGKIPWHRPWRVAVNNGMLFNGATDRPYNGALNQILLNIVSMMNGWTDPRWMGFGQAKSNGWSVKKGEKSTEIFIPIFGYGTKDDGEKFKYVKGFKTGRVWNAAQIKGVPSIAETYDVPDVNPEDGFEIAASIVKSSGAMIGHGGDRAFYSPPMDRIQIPEVGQFESVAGYWSTVMHELVHWTGHEKRLDRGMFGKGRQAYAQEELVAEMGSAFICCWAGIDKPEVTKNHEAYIQSWIERINNNENAFMDASTAAWKAFNLLIEKER